MKSPEEILEGLEAEQADEIAARANYRNLRTKRAQARQIRELNELVESLEQDIATLESLRPKPRPIKPLAPVKRARGGKLPAAFVALASDWHTCEIVKKSQTNGRNEHNKEIGIERAWRWARGLVRLCRDEQQRADVKTLVIWLGGDFLVNDGLHYKSERHVAMSPLDEARIIRDLLHDIIAFIRAEIPDVRIVIVTSWGNHDRSTERMLPGLSGEYSYIQHVYKDLQAMFAKDRTIEFRISESETICEDIHGYRIVFHHGHGIKYKGGVGGLGIPLLKKANVVLRKHNARTFCIGHHHQRGMYEGGTAFSNGSLVGTNGLVEDWMLVDEDPAQVAFLIDLERQEIANYYAIWGT